MINGENLASSVVSGDYRLTHGLCINLVAFVWGFGCGLHWLYHCRVQCCVRRWQQGPEQWWIFILRVCPGFPGHGPEQPAVAAALALLSAGSEQRPPPRGLCSLPSTPPPVWPCLYVMMGPTNATVIDLYHHPSSPHPTLQALWTRTTTHIRSHLQRASGRWAPPHRISADCLLKAEPGRLLSLAQPILLNCPMKVITAPDADVRSGQTLLYCKHQDSTQQKSSLHWVCPWCNGECKTKGR